MSFEVISIIVTIFLAFIGYMVTYWNNVQMHRRQEQLELVNKRISEFYGPLYVTIQSSKKTIDTLKKKLRRERGLFEDPNNPLTEQEMAEWRLWLRHVLMPLNEQMEKILTEKAYLIQEEIMPECLLLFIAHVSAYKAVIKKWKAGDLSESVSVIYFPTEMDEYITKSYKELKAKQLRLIGNAKLSIRLSRKYDV